MAVKTVPVLCEALFVDLEVVPLDPDDSIDFAHLGTIRLETGTPIAVELLNNATVPDFERAETTSPWIAGIRTSGRLSII